MIEATAFKFCDQVVRLKAPDAVLDALHLVARGYIDDFGALGAWYLPVQATDLNAWVEGTTVFVHSELAAVGYLSAYQEKLRENGPAALGALARTRTRAFTFSEAMSMLQLGSSRQAWLFDQFREYGIRDGLYCPFRTWAVTYRSRSILKLNAIERGAFALCAYAAAGQIEKIVPNPRRMDKPPRALSEREREIMRLMSYGKKQREIAEQLGIGVETVRTHVKKAVKKLGAVDATHAVAEAIRARLIP